MTSTARAHQRGPLRRLMGAMPVSVPAGLAAVAVLTGDGAEHLPPALRWAVLVLLGVFVVGDLACGWMWLAYRRAPVG